MNCKDMSLKVTSNIGSERTMRASERLFPCVRPNMVFDVSHLVGHIGAEGAGINFPTAIVEGSSTDVIVCSVGRVDAWY